MFNYNARHKFENLLTEIFESLNAIWLMVPRALLWHSASILSVPSFKTIFPYLYRRWTFAAVTEYRRRAIAKAVTPYATEAWRKPDTRRLAPLRDLLVKLMTPVTSMTQSAPYNVYFGLRPLHLLSLLCFHTTWSMNFKYRAYHQLWMGIGRLGSTCQREIASGDF